MKKFEYASVHLIWAGNGKGISITQFGITKSLSLKYDKKLFEKNHFKIFNRVMEILGADGWELVSISTITGTDISIISDSDTIQSESQEFWFKREVSDGIFPSIQESLSEVFNSVTLKSEEELMAEEKKKINHDLWLSK